VHSCNQCASNISNVIEINKDAVLKCLNKLKESKSPGPDSIHPLVLKGTAEAWDYPLSVLFHQSVATGRLLSNWKNANVAPIHKKGSRSEAGNYRPVSLASVPCKMLESLIM